MEEYITLTNVTIEYKFMDYFQVKIIVLCVKKKKKI